MIMRNLFWKQYLCLSPLWIAFQNNQILNPDCFLMNTKLFSAYAIIMKNNLPQSFETVLKNINVVNKNTQPLYRAQAYLGLANVEKEIDNQQLDVNYLQAIHQYHFSCLNQFDLQKSTNLISKFVAKSKKNEIDELDLLIVSQMNHNKQTLNLLSTTKHLLWTKKSHQNIQKAIKNQLRKQQWQDIGSLKKIIKLHDSEIYGQCSLLKSLYIVLTKDQIERNMRQAQLSKQFKKIEKLKKSNQILAFKKNQKKQNKQIIVRQYSMYIDWLFMRTILSSNVHQFTTSLQNFIFATCIEFETDQVYDNSYLNLLKLELITFLYEIITKTNPEKLSQITKQYLQGNKKLNAIFLEHLKLLKSKYQKICEKQNNTMDHILAVFKINGDLYSDIFIKKVKEELKNVMQKPIITFQIEQLQIILKICKKLGILQEVSKIQKFLTTKNITMQETNNLHKQSFKKTAILKEIIRGIQSKKMLTSEKVPKIQQELQKKLYIIDKNQFINSSIINYCKFNLQEIYVYYDL